MQRPFEAMLMPTWGQFETVLSHICLCSENWCHSKQLRQCGDHLRQYWCQPEAKVRPCSVKFCRVQKIDVTQSSWGNVETTWGNADANLRPNLRPCSVKWGQSETVLSNLWSCSKNWYQLTSTEALRRPPEATLRINWCQIWDRAQQNEPKLRPCSIIFGRAQEIDANLNKLMPTDLNWGNAEHKRSTVIKNLRSCSSTASKVPEFSILIS